MAKGLQIWDAAGVLVFDTSDRVSQHLGRLDLSDGHAAGSITVPDFSRGTPYAAVLGEGRFKVDGTGRTPTRTTCSGTTLSYTAGDSCTILYGIF